MYYVGENRPICANLEDRMATTTPVMTWEAFEQLPDDAMHYEILEGELVTLPPPKSGHSLVASRVANSLRVLEERRLGRVFWEAGYKLSHDPATWIQPDISFLREDRVRATAQDGYFLNAPELAVEVVSPSESARDLDCKVDALLAAGGHDQLSAPELLPGWEFPVAKLFED